VLEVHAGKIGDRLVLDINRLRKALGVDDLPLEERVDETLQGVLMALWEVQNTVISQFYLYSSDMNKKRREGYLTTFQGRELRVWFSYGSEKFQPCPLCGVSEWDHLLGMSLAAGETRVVIPAQARHLMEVHGLAEISDWQVWKYPGDYEKLADFFGVAS
jgi:hypothetical protein